MPAAAHLIRAQAGLEKFHVSLRRPTYQERRVNARDTPLAWVEDNLLQVSTRCIPSPRRRRRRDFIETVIASNDDHRHASISQDLRHHGSRFDSRAPHEHCFGARRVGQRSGDVEHRGHSEFSAGGAGESQGRVKSRSEAEPDPDLPSAGSNRIRTQFDAHPESLERISRSGRAGRGPVAVLDDRRSCRCHHQGRHRRDVHRVRSVPAGADNIDDHARSLLGVDEHRPLHHRVDQGAHLLG